MGRNIGAGVLGVIVAVILVWVIEEIGHSIYPPPPGLDFSDPEAMKAYVDSLPLGALLSVAIAWFAGSLGGTFAACRLGAARSIVYAPIVGGMMFVGAAINFAAIPHPWWFLIIGVAGIVLGAGLGMFLGTRRDDTA
jgi:hypothetical protein